MSTPNPINGKQGFVLELLDKLFKDATTGEIVFYRAILLVILFILLFSWYSKDDLFNLYKQTRYETYQEVIDTERQRKFEMAAQEQLQIAHISSRADFSVMFSFRPRNLNYFIDIIATEGRLPVDLMGEPMGGYPINKTSNEYNVHLTGRHYRNETEFVYLPKGAGDYGYMYSCPFFNLDNVYAGSVSLFWKEKPVQTDANLFVICNQASRIMGRLR